MVDARVKGSKVPVSVVAPRSGVHFEVARLLRAARQGVVVATGLTVFAPGSADAQVTCPAPTPTAQVGSLVLNPDTGTCFTVAGLLTYADAKQLNPALNITAVTNPNDVVYLRGTGNEAVLVQTDPSDFVFTLANGVPSTQLYQVRSVTTVAGNPALVTAVSLYPAGADPAASGTVFTPYDPVFVFTPAAGTTAAPVAPVAPTVTAGAVNLPYAGASGGDGSDGYILGSGGDGGNGATGPTVTVIVRNTPPGFFPGVPSYSFSDPINTTAAGTAGIRVGSAGGDGGDGGSAYSLVGDGGDGGIGGAGGTVDVTNYVTVNTAGAGSAALVVYSQSGVGGSAGSGGLIGGGGSGGAARDGGNVTVTNGATGVLSTNGVGSYGIQALSTGGAGGSGGSSFAIIGLAGSAAGSGSGGVVRVTNNGQVFTAGDRSYGILAQSMGGSGGDGGNAGGLAAWSTDGAQGGNGGSVFVTNTNLVQTDGVGSHGVIAQSIGGGGGSGGNAGGLVALAAGGGKSGYGGSVTVTNEATGTIKTLAASSNAILAQSIGGGGGTGGASGGLVGLSSAGGGGGSGGSVTVTNRGLLQTSGSDSRGIKAQSIGGGGGDGGGAGGLVALAGGGGGASPGGAVTANNSGDILTGKVGQSGSFSDAIFAQSVGGGGGEGAAAGGLVALSLDAGGGAGAGGAVQVTNSGYLQTLFADSYGIFAQSVGGGGGAGGEAGGLVALSGGGGGAGNGGAVRVANNLGGNISTSGARSGAIFAQSVGGGGGNGAPSGGLVALSGNASNSGGGSGNTVTVSNAANLTTRGTESKGLFAQSVGGGGGAGGASGGLVALSGSGGGAGNGGAVSVTNAGQILTGTVGVVGSASTAIYAQSVGGGGGEGATAGGLVALSAAGGGSGDGGTVSVINAGLLQTLFSDSFGIFAESVGGGGGAGGASGGLVALSGSGGGAGKGGTVTVTNAYDAALNVNGGGDISTTGDRSTAIFAHSIGGGGGYGTASGGLVALGGNAGAGNDGGVVIVTNDGALTTQGTAAKGIFAQSVGGGGGAGGESGGLVALSGSGGGSGKGDTVTVTNAGQILTGKRGVAGSDAAAIYAQSVGGGGGAGVASGGIVALGSSGGGAGNGGDVAVTNSGVLQTLYQDSFGIFAQSVGGGGGAGGAAGGLVAISGDGGGAGYGGNVTVNNSGAISTLGGNAGGPLNGVAQLFAVGSAAIYAQSVGGGGGYGSGSGGLVGISGGGGGASQGGSVTATNSGALTTVGGRSYGVFAQSVGGGGGESSAAGGLVGVSGSGGGAGYGGVVRVNNLAGGNITTYGIDSVALFAQSVGGGGGSGDVGAGLGGVGGGGGVGANGGAVTVVNNANLLTWGAGARGIFAQSTGGGGGSGGLGGGLVGVGGASGAGAYGGAVTVNSVGDITTHGVEATAIHAQSIGGGGGDGGEGGGLFTFGGIGAGDGTGAKGGAVIVTSRGDLTVSGKGSKGIFAESVGGGGGSGGAANGVVVTVGGNGGTGSDGGFVQVTVGGAIHTSGTDGLGIHAQSVGGGGGAAGDANSGSLFFGMSIGGDGGAASRGGDVNIQLEKQVQNGLLVASSILTDKDRSTGILAQSVGGGGGSGGNSVQASAGAFINVSVAIGGKGAAGSAGGTVTLTGAGNVTTGGDVSPGVVIQSVGGGGGNGGSTVSASLAAGEGLSLAGAVALGGASDSGGNGGAVRADVDSFINTTGHFSTGFLAQSVGGGGGNGGNAISAAASFSDGAAGAAGIALGGSGSLGGTGGAVSVTLRGAVTTGNDQSDGIVVQSVGGGGGNAGTTVAASLGAAGTTAGNLSVGLGGAGGAGGNAGDVFARLTADVSARGDGSDGVVVQAIGGGGGNSGLTVGAGLAGSGVDAATVNVGIGGTAGSAGDGGTVDAHYSGNLSTVGNSATGILAQSVGGGGGNSGGTIAAGLSFAGEAAGAIDVAIGGDGGGGGAGGRAGVDRAVTLQTLGSVTTHGISSSGIVAQSIGGGGGNGGYSVAGGAAGSFVASGTIGVGLGGIGAGGGAGKAVFANMGSVVLTLQDASLGVLVQSVGGGGGNGGLNVSGGIAGAGTVAANVAVGLGGNGGTGNVGGRVDASATGPITTYGNQSHGFVAQSVGGGGGNGAGNVAASITGAGELGAVGINVGLGGAGGTAGHGGLVIASTRGDVVTFGAQSVGVLAQSIGGGGGNGAFNVSAGLAGSEGGAAAIDVGLGGHGGTAGDGGEVRLTVNNNVFTFGGDASDAGVGTVAYQAALFAARANPLWSLPVGLNADAGAIIAQSVGGGGGNGGLNVAASGAGAGAGSLGISVGLGGDADSGGDGGRVTANTTGQVFTVGNGSNGILAQSIGGGGGNGATNVSGTISGASIGNGSLTVGLGGSGALGGTGGDVDLTVNGPVFTFGERARGVIAQSVGGGGGNGGVNVSGTLAGAGTGSGDITVAIGGAGGGGGTSGRVDANVVGNILTAGDFSDGLIVQTIGGGGGNSAITVGAALSGAGVGTGSAKISLGGAGGAGSDANIVNARYAGAIDTVGDFSRGMLVQSIGGGGGNAGGNVAAGFSGAGTGGSGDIAVGIGGDGGGAGDGGLAGVALAVTAASSGQIVTRGNYSGAFIAQSIGGGGGSGGFNVAASGSGAGTGSIGVGVGLGGDGLGGGAGKGVNADIQSNIWTSGHDSTGVLVQSVGGGGGNGGFNVTAVATFAGTGAGNASIGLGGSGAKGGAAGTVRADASGTIATIGDNSGGFVAQSIGGGGGNGGFNVAVSVSGAGTGSGAIGVGLGGNGDSGSAGGEVYASTAATVTTRGNNSAGVLAQSVGGGGGNGGFVVDVAASGAGTGSGSVAVGLGGSGAGGGAGDKVELGVHNDVSTLGSNSAGIIAQSIGGGGGNGGFEVTVPISFAGTGSGVVGVGLGGRGGLASAGGTVLLTGAGVVTTGVAAEFLPDGVAALTADPTSTDFFTRWYQSATGNYSAGVIAQSIGGGGGTGGFDVTAAISGAKTGSGALSVGLGGSGGGGGDGGSVASTFTGAIRTAGFASTGLLVQSVGGGGGNGGFSVAGAGSGAGTGSGVGAISLGGSGEGGGAGNVVTSLHTGTVDTYGNFSTGVIAQSLGGGGGNGGFSVAAGISGAKTGSGALSLGLGGSGGAGNSAGMVTSTQVGDVVTRGAYSGGVLAQSVGGGGGNGGFAVSGAISIAGDGSGAVGVGLGGSGGSGGAAGVVSNTVAGNVLTDGQGSFGVIAQSVGGGGGTGGLNVTGTLAVAKKGAGSLGVGIGGTGGSGGTAAAVANTVTGYVRTQGDQADGIFTQSLGGGGGSGGLNVTGNITASKEASGNLAVGIGGFGGEGGVAGSATSTVTGGVSTAGNQSIGILTQSLGGGGGNGALNITGSVNVSTSGSGGNLGVGIGGFGASGGDAGLVVSHVTMTDVFDRVTTQGDNASAVMAQSIGGGGGNGGLNITGTFNFSAKSGGSAAIGVGGFGGGAGDGKDVTLGVDGLVVTQGSDSHGLVAQSVGGGGGAGGMNVSGSIAITKASTKATQVGVAIGVGGFGGGGGTAGTVTVAHDGSVYSAMALREFVPESIDPVTGAVIPAHEVLKDVPGVLVPEEVVAGERTPAYYLGQGGYGSHGIVAQSIGGGGGAGGTNISGSISAAFGTSADAYGIVVGVGGFGGAGGDAGAVKVEVTGGENIATAGRSRSGLLAQSIGGGGGDGGTNVTGSISTDAPLLVGVGGFGANAGLGKQVEVHVAANINVLGADSDEQGASAGLMAQSIGGGGGNGGLNVTGGLVWAKEKGLPSVNVGVGGFGGAGAASGDVTVTQVGTITTAGSYTHGLMAQSIGGGGGNGALNISGQLNGADSKDSGGKTDVSIIAGVGGNAGEGATAGNVGVTQSGQIVTTGDYARGIVAQSIGGGGGVGGMNITAIIASKSAPVSVGVGGSGAGGGTAGTVTVLRGDALTAAGAIFTGGAYAHGIEASSIGGGGGDAGMNFNLGYTGAGKTNNDPNSFAAQFVIGGAGGTASDGKAARVENHGDILTVGAGSYGILAQSIGGGGGNANFNIAVTYAGASTSPPGLPGKLLGKITGLFGGGSTGAYDPASTKANQNLGFSLALGGATGDGGDGGNVDVVHQGNISTYGANAYGILSQSIGGGGGNAGLDLAFVKADGGKAGITIGRVGGTGGVGGDVTLDSNGEIRTFGSHAFGLLAQSIGNGGGNSSATSVAAEFPSTNKDGSITANTFGVAIGLEGGIGGHAGDVILKASGLVATEGDKSHALFAQSVGGGGGNGGSANVAGITAGTKFAMGGTGGEGGYGGVINVTTSAQVHTLGANAIGVLAQSLGGGGGDGGRVTGGGAKSGNQGIDVLLGGDGGTGMTGGLVTVDNSGVIITRGIGAHGVLAQSLGGGGGNSGMTIDTVGSASADSPTRAAILIGGAGGEGATGGEVIVTNTGGIGTEKAGAVGLFAQSIGGKGGNAELVLISTVSGTKGGNTLSLAMGGSGGSGGAGGAVTVANLPTAGDPLGGIITLGGKSHGIFAMSLGGGGGTGASSTVINRVGNTGLSSTSATTVRSISLAMGGSGGVGGVGGAVTVNNAQRIVTYGGQAHGILAQSVGGGGGDGGTSVVGATAVGITKEAQSLGGISNKELSLGVSLGGVGGSGNASGAVTVTNSGTIDVNGDRSYGVYAQSVGGGGGDGGLALTLSKDLFQKQDMAASLTKFALGGAGGDGADGGAVTVTNTGTITVRGDDGVGIFAQSVGGGGGNTGTSISSPVWTAGALVMDQILGARDGTNGAGGIVTVNQNGSIVLAGARGRAVVSQSVTGGGGKSELFLDVSQQAVTLGDDGFQLPDNSGDVDKAKAYVTGLIKQGADGLHLAEARDAVVGFRGDVLAFGKDSIGVLVQAVGGGGGLSDSTVYVANDGGQTVNLDAQLGGTSVSDSAGGHVDYTQAGAIYQQGEGSAGTIVQSVGGGGGVVTLRVSSLAQVPVLPPAAPAASVSTDEPVFQMASVLSGPVDPNSLTLNAALGGTGGVRNDGGDVTLTRSGAIQTQGAHSTAFVAQSIGAGGGQLLSTGLTQLQVTVGGSQGASGDGGALSFTNVGTVTTTGLASHGVMLQSIGGGGGLALSDTAPQAVTVVTSADNSGNGGNLLYRQEGAVNVLGAGSYGIVLQSLGGGGGWVDDVFAGTAGGTGRGGRIGLTLTDGVFAPGAAAVAIKAQSLGSLGGGDISIDASGAVRGNLAGIQLDGGASNTVTVRGSLSAISGQAITASSGNDAVTNHGLLVGNVDLGGGTNVLTNATDGVFVAMSTIDLRTQPSAPSKFVNDGDFQMGLNAAIRPLDLAAGAVFATTDASGEAASNLLLGTRVVNAVALDGNFLQSASGHLAFDVAYGPYASDRVNVSGSATVAGKGDVTLTWLQDHRDTLLFAAAGGGVDRGLQITDTLAMNYSTFGDGSGIHLTYQSNFAQPFLNRNGQALGVHMDSMLTVGKAAGVGRLMSWLGNLQRGSEALYSGLFAELNPEPYLSPLVTQLEASTAFSQGLFGCAEGLQASERACGRMQMSNQDVQRDGDLDSLRIEESGSHLAGWLQGPMGNGWSMATSFQYDQIDRLATDGLRAQADGTGLHLGLGARLGAESEPAVAFSVTGGWQWMQTRRLATLFVAGQGIANTESGYLQGEMSVSRRLQAGRFFARPSLTASTTALHQASFREQGLAGNGVAGLAHTQLLVGLAPEVDLGLVIRDEPTQQASLVFSFGALYRSDQMITMPYRLLGSDAAADPAQITTAVARQSYRMGVDLNLFTSEQFSLKLGYAQRYGDQIRSNASHLSVQWRF